MDRMGKNSWLKNEGEICNQLCPGEGLTRHGHQIYIGLFGEYAEHVENIEEKIVVV